MLQTSTEKASVVALPAEQETETVARERVALTVMLGSAGESAPGAAEKRIARANDIALAYASHFPAAYALLQQEEFRRRAYQTLMHETSEILTRRGVPHIYIKHRRLYPFSKAGVDVVVQPRRWPEVADALAHAGYTGHTMFKEPNKIMFSRPACAMTVHLHAGITWNGVPYLADADVWRHTVRVDEGAWLELDPEYDLLTHLAHDMFQNFEISLGDLLYFKLLLREYALDSAALETVAARNGWRMGFKRIYAMVLSLLQGWDHAQQTGVVPSGLLAYPYRIPLPALVGAFAERIARNATSGHLHSAFREAYAYPFFWALKRRHDLPWFGVRASGED